MPINVYTGLMRSGKSYEVVSQVIVEAIAKGRRVVTNVDGISNDLIRAYVVEKRKLPLEGLGHVVHVTNEDVFRPDFLPYFDDAKEAHVDTICQPGDLVCIDEAWRFWGADCKLHKNHKSFFLEHGHFTHPETGVACDLVLMIQDMGTLHRFVKNVVAFSFRTHKKVSLGLGNTYSVQMWEGHKMTKATQIGSWVRRYAKEVFPLYSSFKGGADGRMVNADSRQNVWMNRWLWIKIGTAVAAAVFCGIYVWHFFHRTEPLKTAREEAAKTGPGAVPPSGASSSNAPSFSSDWRVAGILVIGDRGQVLMIDGAGRIRPESPSLFQFDGIARVGQVDGQRVTTFSGSAVKPVASSPGGLVAPVPTTPSGALVSAAATLPSPFAGSRP